MRVDNYNIPDYLWYPKDSDLQSFQDQLRAQTTDTVPREADATQQISITLEALQANVPRVNGNDAFEQTPNSDDPPKDGDDCTLIPHPLSDFSHPDPDTAYYQSQVNLGILEGLPAYKRLSTLFAFLLKRIVEILSQLNTSNAGQFETARTTYLQFVAGLDDHDQWTGADGAGHGYGKLIKWFNIKPRIVVADDSKRAVITGVQFVIKWNPISSSSSK